jgi:hypothetical protein
MTEKKYKYSEYLNKFQDCPASNFVGVNKEAYRWTSSLITIHDFTPINITKTPPPRMLDDSDKMCTGYGLSMFDSLSNSLLKYQKEYSRRNVHQQEHFKQDKGSYIALLHLTENDGVADAPNSYGHFTFHEYLNTCFETRHIVFYNIFKDDGTFNI